MGNCAASQHPGESWADDGEWEEASEEEGDHHHHAPEEHMSEVTIRITKRQLHELMKKERNGRGIKSQELLADIMNSGEVHHHDLHRETHWKPALLSIPEAVEPAESSSIHGRDCNLD